MAHNRKHKHTSLVIAKVAKSHNMNLINVKMSSLYVEERKQLYSTNRREPARTCRKLTVENLIKR